MKITGSCFCRALEYEINLQSADDARTSLCHCKNCTKGFGTNYGLTTKLPKDSFAYTKGNPKEHISQNGNSRLYREFCDTCGSFILEYGEQNKDKFRYICYGSLDDPERMPPKGEFMCKYRATWMPEISGLFHKREIME